MALTANVVWEVRTTGADTNGGGYDASIAGAGTDYSQQTGAQATGSAGAAAGTTTFTDTVAANFTSAMVGNVLQIASGTGFTAGFYTITGFTSSTSITLDRAPGTGSVAVWAIGGCLATIAKAMTANVAGNTTWVKATATYSVSATINIGPTGSSATSPSQLYGYTTTRGDGGSPTVQATANSVNIFSLGSSITNWVIGNFILDSNSKTTSGCLTAADSLVGVMIMNIVAKNFTSFGFKQVGGTFFFNCSATGGTAAATGAYVSTAANGRIEQYIGCSAVSNSCPGFAFSSTSNHYIMENCIAGNNSGASNDGFSVTESNMASILRNCVAYNNGRDGLRLTGTGGFVASGLIMGCIFVNNGGWGINSVTDNITSASLNPSNYNAFYNNTSGARTQWPAGANDVTLTGDPFTSGAGNNFTLNNTASAGAACRAANWPGVLQGITGTGYPDIGALQHQDSGTGGGLLVHPGMAGGMRG